MAVWRRKVDDLFPELRADFAEDKPLTLYLVFYTLLPFVREAHRRGDEDALRRVYEFAYWCHRHRDLENAVGVGFYEHLFDDWSLRREVIPWLSPDVRSDILSLWEYRLESHQMAELRLLLAQL
jgi:hypothetical protein